MPKISVVAISVEGLPVVDECLQAIGKQRGTFDTEVIVVSCSRNGAAEHIRKNFPGVKLLQPSERLGIPELRTIGVAQATGDIVAITEDRCIAPENWFEEIAKAHESGYGAVGGAIENGGIHRIVDWAVYLCEYSYSMLPIPHGEVEGIPGNNASYKRGVLERVDEHIRRTCWESFIHEEMKKQGVKFLSVPTIVVRKKKEFGFLYFLAQRFHYSRSFAGMRKAKLSAAKRMFYVFFSPFLPFLMTWRTARQVFLKQRYRKEFLLSLPLLAVFMVSYAVGEFVGYLLGPGKSLMKVE